MLFKFMHGRREKAYALFDIRFGTDMICNLKFYKYIVYIPPQEFMMNEFWCAVQYIIRFYLIENL